MQIRQCFAIFNNMRALFLLVLVFGTSCTVFQKDVEERESREEVVVDFDLSKIIEKGELTAIVDNSSTSYFIYKGQPMGYEHDLLKRYAEEIGVELRIVVTKSIEEAISMLNSGEGDLIAYFMTVTKERKKRVSFTDNFITTRQVLIQKKPEGWKKMWSGNVEKQLVRNQVELIGQEVNVRQSSAFVQRLNHLSEEIGGDIVIVEEDPGKETEDLIEEVLAGKIKFTVADEDIALINSAYYPDLDAKTPLSFPQQIAWAMRKNSPKLKASIDQWIKDIKQSSFHQVIYNKYFRVNRRIVERAQSDFSSISGSNISEYDELIKQYSDSIDWDWKLTASLMYQESRFNANVTSWAGARGLMQVMPRTGRRFGATNLYVPEQNISAGTGFLEYLEGRWKDEIADSVERKKFILASYNAGVGHVQDAIALAKELGYEPTKWDGQVEEAMRLKSKPQYFRMEVVKFGYCRGESVVAYVENIIKRYEQYNTLFAEVSEPAQ